MADSSFTFVVCGWVRLQLLCNDNGQGKNGGRGERLVVNVKDEQQNAKRKRAQRSSQGCEDAYSLWLETIFEWFLWLVVAPVC